MAKGTKKKKEPRVIPGTSDYVVRENAARKQLGVAGLAARNKQVPAAARATLREMTGIDISRKGVSIDPMGVAMALPIGKVLKAAKALRAAGNIARADALTARVVAKAAGGSRAAARGQREQKVVAFMRPEWPGVFGPSTSRRAGDKARGISEKLFPRVGGTSATASSRLQKVADTITKRHYGDVAKKGVGHDVAVNMPRAKVLRNLKAKRGIQINRPR